MRTQYRLTVVLVVVSGSVDAAPVRGDVELDPAAYALSGDSIHVGIGYGRFRFDLGTFGLEVPRFLHTNDAFDVVFDGYGLKLQWFRCSEQTGLFVGVDASVARFEVHRRGTDLAIHDHQIGTGVNIGYRVALPANFYVTPWIGVGYQWGADDVVLGGERFEANRFTLFPAVHLGYRFR